MIHLSYFFCYYFFFFFFFFNDTATTEIYTLSLHDALPISLGRAALSPVRPPEAHGLPTPHLVSWTVANAGRGSPPSASEYSLRMVGVEARMLPSPSVTRK